MAQDVGDLLERRSGTQQPARNAVPQDVYSRIRQAASPIGLAHCTLHHAGSDWLVVGRDMADEHGSAWALRPFRDEVAADRATGLAWQRQHVGAPRLGLDETH